MESEALKELRTLQIVGHRPPNQLMLKLEELRRTLNADDSMLERYVYFIASSKFGTDCSFAIRAERIFEDGRPDDAFIPEHEIIEMMRSIINFYDNGGK